LSPSLFGISPFAFSPLRVFVNSVPLELAPGASALEAVRALDSIEATEVSAGRRVITDSRGLPLDPSTVMSAGSILRVVPLRPPRAADAP